MGEGTMVDGRGRAQQKAATRRRLLRAAVQVFGSGSVMTTPVEAVASAAGVSKATLFFHFGSRLDLLEEVASAVYGSGTAWRQADPGLAPFLDAYLAAQRLPETRLVWEIGDVLSVEGRSTPSTAYRHLMDHIAQRLAEDGFGSERCLALAGVVAPAALLVARRIAYGEVDDQEVARFRDDLDALLAPHRESA